MYAPDNLTLGRAGINDYLVAASGFPEHVKDFRKHLHRRPYRNRNDYYICLFHSIFQRHHFIRQTYFLCRGSIDLARTARRLRIPEGEKGHLSPERFEKQKESLGHPNAEELAQCQTEVKEFLKAL